MNARASTWRATLLAVALILPVVVGGQNQESAAAAAEKDGRLQEAFDLYLKAYQALPDPSPPDSDVRIREKIIQLAPKLSTAPRAPEDAERFLARARVAVADAKDFGGYETAEIEIRKALRLAPWSAFAAYNLALIHEQLQDYQQAMANLRLYVLTNPPDAADIKSKQYELEYKWEQALKDGRNDIDITYGRRTNSGLGTAFRLTITQKRAKLHFDDGGHRKEDIVFEEGGAITRVGHLMKQYAQWPHQNQRADYCNAAYEKERGYVKGDLRRTYERRWKHSIELAKAKRAAVALGTKRTIAGQTCEDWRMTVGKFGAVRQCLLPVGSLPMGYRLGLITGGYPKCDDSLTAGEMIEAEWMLHVLRDARTDNFLSASAVPLAWQVEPAAGYDFKGEVSWANFEATSVRRGPVPPRLFQIPSGFTSQ